MKKTTLFILSSLFGLALFAAGRQPMVTINTTNDYEVLIDGTYYKGNNTIPNLSQGTHSVQVYQSKRGLLGKRRTLVSSSSFEVRDNDVKIFVDTNGQLRINESGNRNRSERRNRTNDDYDRRNNNGDDNDWRNRGSNRNHDRHEDHHDEEDNNDDYNDKKIKKDKKEKHNNGHYNGNGKKLGHQKHHHN